MCRLQPQAGCDPVLNPHPRPAPWGPTPRAPHSPEPAQPSLCLDPMDQSCLGSCLPSVCDLLMGRDNSMLHPFQMWKLRLGEQVHHPVLHRSSPAPSFRTQHECSLFSEAALTTPSNVALLLPHPPILPPCSLISFPLGLCLLLYRGNTWEPRAPILVPTVPGAPSRAFQLLPLTKASILGSAPVPGVPAASGGASILTQTQSVAPSLPGLESQPFHLAADDHSKSSLVCVSVPASC